MKYKFIGYSHPFKLRIKQDFSNCKTINDIFKAKYCSYYMDKAIKQSNHFLERIKKTDCFMISRPMWGKIIDD